MFRAALLAALGILTLPAQERAISVVPAPTPAAEQRIALVIGNGAYADAPLRNPVNDARGMKAALELCKFEVALLENAGKREMEDAIRAFGDRIRGGAVGLFYFAGHGVQVKGVNYLVPVGANMAREDEVPYQAVEAGQVLDKMDAAKNKLNILILDACRNNPFARSWRSGGDKGLAQVKAPTGTLICYATAPGSVAADGLGQNGLYTEALLAQMKEPGQELEKVFKKVREKVLAGSSGAQTPWESNSTVGDFYFRPLTTFINGPTQAQVEATYWEGVQDSRKASDFEAFLAQFPSGHFVELAKAKLANLRRVSENTVVVNNLAEPWKALQKDKLETRDEYAARIAQLGAVSIGTAVINVDNYDVETRHLTLPITPDPWAKPYVKQKQVKVELDRAQMRALVAAGSIAAVATWFTVRDGQAQAGTLALSTSLGALQPAPPPPPTRNAQGCPEVKVEVEGVILALVLIPAGRFQMGWPGNTGNYLAHEVKLTKDFWMGKFPVTQGQWQAVMGNNPAYFKSVGLDAPVEQVSWDDAQQFLTKLNALQDQFTFRLPTESEWEYGCRAGTTGGTYGSLDAIAWHNGNSGGTTHPVGQKQPNAFGLYDMNGNVLQWCQDWYDKSYYHGSPSVDPPGASSGQDRVLRGGSWSMNDWGCHSAFRCGKPPALRNHEHGFRVVAIARTP